MASMCDNSLNGLYGVMKDAMQSAFNKGVEHGKRVAQKEFEEKIRNTTDGHSCRLCCVKEVIK